MGTLESSQHLLKDKVKARTPVLRRPEAGTSGYVVTSNQQSGKYEYENMGVPSCFPNI
jgi:hypothetical protein